MQNKCIKILVLCSANGGKLASGYAVAVYKQVEYLVKQGIDVRVIFTNFEDSKESIAPKGVRHYSCNLSKKMKVKAGVNALIFGKSYACLKWQLSEVVQLALSIYEEWKFDIVQAENALHMVNALKIGDRQHVPVIFRSHDTQYELFSRISNDSPNPLFKWIYRRESKLFKIEEIRAINKSAYCIPISKVSEKSYRLDCFPDAKLKTIQIGPHEFDPYLPSVVTSSPHKFIHMGSLSWKPNYYGFKWFCETIWPAVQEKIPDASLYVCGSQPRHIIEEFKKYKENNIRFTGFVEDLNNFVKDKSALLVPLKSGSGIRVKILTAWGLGLPVISTKLGIEGIKASNQVDYLQANSAAEFVHAVEQIQNSTTRTKLVKNAFNTIENNFGWQKISSDMVNVYEKVLECRA